MEQVHTLILGDSFDTVGFDCFINKSKEVKRVIIPDVHRLGDIVIEKVLINEIHIKLNDIIYIDRFKYSINDYIIKNGVHSIVALYKITKCNHSRTINGGCKKCGDPSY